MSDELFALGHDQEYWRLRANEASFDRPTLRLLEELGVAPGWRCLDVGSGAGSIAIALHARTGSVTALDLDCSYISHLASPSFVLIESDVETAVLPTERDLVHCRFLLDLVEQPFEILTKLRDCLRTSGLLFVEEFDDLTLEASFRDDRAQDLHLQIVEAKQGLWETRGFGNHVGRDLPGWLVELGLADVESECSCRVRFGGTAGALAWKQALLGMRDGLVTAGLIPEAEVDEYFSYLDSGGISYFSPLVVRAWGRMP